MRLAIKWNVRDDTWKIRLDRDSLSITVMFKSSPIFPQIADHYLLQFFSESEYRLRFGIQY